MWGGWGIYSPNHQTSCLVGLSVAWCTGQSGAPATSPGRWVPTVGALTCGPTWLSGGAPDNLVNYSGAPLKIPEGEELGVEFPGAPDTVRWHTGQSDAPDQGAFGLYFALFV